MGTETFAKITRLELSVVRVLARKLEPGARGLFDRGDLESAGNMLLVEAALAYDPIHGVAFRTYASRSVLFGLLDAIRAAKKTRRRAREELALAGHSAFDRGYAELDPAIRREAEDASSCLEAALACLDPGDAALVRGFHLEGRSYADLAAELGIPTTSAWRRGVAAFAQLQRWMRAVHAPMATIDPWSRRPRTRPTGLRASTPSRRPPTDSPLETSSEATASCASSDSWRRAG